MSTETQLSFVGTSEEKTIAAHAFEVMKRKGILFAANAPIRMNAQSIATSLTKAGGALAGQDPAALSPKIEAALRKNPEIFNYEPNGDFVTTKSGRPPRSGGDDGSHTFKQRLNAQATALDADAARDYAESLVNKAQARSDRPVVDMGPELPSMPIVIPLPHAPQITFEHTTVIPQHLMPLPSVEAPKEPEETKAPAAPQRPAADVTPAAPAAPVQAPPSAGAPQTPVQTPRPAVQQPAAQPPAVQEPAPAVPAPAVPQEQSAPAPQFADTTVTPEAPVSRPAQELTQPPAQVPPSVPAPAPVQSPTQPPAQAQPQTQVPSTPAAPAQPAQPPARPAQEAPARPAAPAPAPTVAGPIEVQVPTAEGPVTIDLLEPVDDILANEAAARALTDLVSHAVEEDSRIVRFGSEIFPDEAIERFSKGDFRRIKDFLAEPETGGVASDVDFMDYVLNRRPEHPDYDRLRFSLDYRLLREKKDFEFVGTDTNRLWMEAGSIPVASPKRKPAEIGQDYRYLEDPAIASVEEEEVQIPEGPYEHTLTYYEYEHGVLPYDYRAKAFFAGPVLEEQRASLLQFEIPQLYTSVLVELRFPTGNRGGFIMGLADFFAEHMVPGATFTVLPTDRADNIFEIQFTRPGEREESLLQLDERKGRYVFRPVEFNVGTQPTMLLTQEKFGKLHNQKTLEEAERRRPDVVIVNAFEAVGDSVDGKLWAILDDIFPAVNLDRPMSRTWLRTMLSGAYPFFYADESTEGAYFYDASKRPS